MSQPLIDSARLKFSGISSEDFEDIPEIGDARTFTIRARCTKHTEELMASEGTRKIANMKIEKILTGVDKKIDAEEDAEPSLFDTPADDDPDDEGDEGDERPPLPDDEDEPEPDDEGASVSSIGTGFAGGPQFSAGGDE